jgi:hypothetical protein
MGCVIGEVPVPGAKSGSPYVDRSGEVVGTKGSASAFNNYMKSRGR